ncbi:MAG: hypothetical protein BJ554DRAFT_7809, partial [Olpidium bornovanus]
MRLLPCIVWFPAGALSQITLPQEVSSVASGAPTVVQSSAAAASTLQASVTSVTSGATLPTARTGVVPTVVVPAVTDLSDLPTALPTAGQPCAKELLDGQRAAENLSQGAFRGSATNSQYCSALQSSLAYYDCALRNNLLSKEAHDKFVVAKDQVCAAPPDAVPQAQKLFFKNEFSSSTPVNQFTATAVVMRGSEIKRQRLKEVGAWLLGEPSEQEETREQPGAPA